MAIIKNKYKDKIDKQIKIFPNGTVPSDFTKKIIYDNETVTNPTIVRAPKYGDDLNTTEFSKLVADLVYNDTIINEESQKHNYLYSNGIIKNYKKEFEIYDKNLLQVLAIYDINNIIDIDTFSLKPSNSIAGNFSNNTYCKFYFYTNSNRLLNLFDFFYKEFNVTNIITQNNNTETNFKDDYSVIIFDGEINITNANLETGESIGIVMYLPNTVRNTTPYKSKNFIDYMKVGNGALKIGDTFVDIKKDTYISRSVTSNNDFNQIKVININETKFKDSYRTRRDILLAYFDQNSVIENISFEGIIDLIIGDERINTYSPVDSQIFTTPRIKKIEYLTVSNESFHRIHLDDLCLLKGINQNGQEILFRKVNQVFTIRNSINNIFDGEYIIKAINYTNKTIDFVHPSFDGEYYQPEDIDNTVGYYGYLVPNIYILYSLLIYKTDGYGTETQIMQADNVYDYVGLESGINRIEKTVLEINSNGMFEVSKNDMKHLKNFNGNLLEYDDAQSLDVPSKSATSFTLNSKTNGDYILRPAEQQLPNEYDEIGLNSLSNSHFVITEDNFSVINNSKISLSEVYLGVKNSLSSIGTEGIKIKIESLSMLYPFDDQRRIESIEAITQGNEFRISLFVEDTNIRVNDILFITNNIYSTGDQFFYGNGDFQTVKIKRIENGKLIIDKINSTYTAEFKRNFKYPIYFNIIKYDQITKICESLLTNDEIKNQIINGLNGKFGDKNSYSKLKFDKFIYNIDPNNDLLKNGITLSQTQDFKLDINKYYFISVAGFVINNIAGIYSSILIENHNEVDDLHFKKSIYYEVNIKSFKGRYPHSLIISDEFGDINVFDITRTFTPFFRMPKYSIMAYDFSNLEVSLKDIPPSENVVLFDPLSGRFKFHPNATPSRIYLSYYTTENLSGAAEAENFIYKRGEDSNDTIRGKIQELDNKYVYGASFNSPIGIDGVFINNGLNYKGPFRIKDNIIQLKTNANFVDIDVNKYEIEIDKNSNYEIIDIEKKSLFLKTNVVEKNNEIQSINRTFLDQLHDQVDKNHYESPVINKNEEVVFNISEDTTINQSLINSKKWQYVSKTENDIVIPFLANKKFNKINFFNFDENLIVNCTERTKTENLTTYETNLNDILEEFVYRKLKEKNYKYALKKDYSEDTTISFRDYDEIKQMNKTIVKDSKYFNKSEMADVFIESEDNSLLKRETFTYNNLNINNTNSDNFIIINDHIINFDLKIINKKYTGNITFGNQSLQAEADVPSTSSLEEGTLYFFSTSGYNQYLDKNIEISDFIIKNENSNGDIGDWDFYKKNNLFNVSKLVKGEDLVYSLNDFNDINVDFEISMFDYCLQNKLVNSVLIRNGISKINEERFLTSTLIRDTNDVYSLYIQIYELNDENFYSPLMINGDYDYFKIASSQSASDFIKINKNNLYYDFLTLDNETIVFCIMSDSFLFKYLHLDDLTFDDGVTFINDKQIKNNPKLFKLNDEIFSILFNSENTFNYDNSVGDLEFKMYKIKDKTNLIFSYKENSLNYSKVDKIVVDNIKNISDYNYLKMNDDNIIVFYSNVNSFYLNNITLNNNEYTTDYPSGLLNSFKVINFKKTEEDYIFNVSNKRLVYYQNIGQTAFPPKIYPFKISANIFGVNYIQYNLNNIETGNRLYTYNVDGVLQKEKFINDQYTQENPENIKYIYNFNGRQAIEFSTDKIVIHNFNNDYSSLIIKEDIDYKKYFPTYQYATIFQNKIGNAIEIKTVKDINGKPLNKKVLTFFTKQNNTYKLNITSVNDLMIDFSDITTFEISFGNLTLVEENGLIEYQNDIIYYGDKIFLIYIFLAYDTDLTESKLLISLVNIGDNLLDSEINFSLINNVFNIKNIKREENQNADSKNKFFFNKIASDKIEIYSLRGVTLNSIDKNMISKHTMRIKDQSGACEFLESRLDEGGVFNLNNQNIDLIFNENEINIKNIYRINYNSKIKYIAESYNLVNNIDTYNYFLTQENFQILYLFNLSINRYNVKHVNYNQKSNELLFFGHIENNLINYVFNFNTNLIEEKNIDALVNTNYNFLKIQDTDSSCFLYYKIINSFLHLKIYVKKEGQEILLAYEKTYNYVSNFSDIIFNNYDNNYDTFLYLGNTFIRSIWKLFPMNSISKNENILENEIIANKIMVSQTYKEMFSCLSLSGILDYSASINKNLFTIFDENLIKNLNNKTMINCIFYVNNNSNLCVFKILSKLPQTDYYEIEYLVGGNNKANLLNKKIDYMLYVNEDYTFYKKSYQSLALKLEMFNYKGIKKNEYEIYRKNNYYYFPNTVFEYNTLYKSNVFLIKGDYKDFQVIYHLDDEYEETKIYAKKYLIISNSLYSFEEKTQLLIDKYEYDDKIDFICEKLANSNIFFSFKKNNNYVYNFILNKNYGLEEMDPDFTRRELYKFITINDKILVNSVLTTVNVLQNESYMIEPYMAKRIFNDYLLFLLKITKDGVSKIAHILYKENGVAIDYYNSNYNKLYTLLDGDDVIGYSKPNINSYGYTSIFIYRKDFSRDILQFGIDGEGGVCKLRGINNLF